MPCEQALPDHHANDANPAVLSGTNGERYPSTHKQAQFTIDHWEGFIGTCEPKILDAAILPDLVISIYLADNNVLTSSAGVALEGTGATDLTDAGSGSATYELNNIHATIESIGLADAVYDNMVSAMIAQKGYIEIPFKQYVSFSNTHSGSTRFTVATQSLDRVWFAFRESATARIHPLKQQIRPRHANGLQHGLNLIHVSLHYFSVSCGLSLN